jgi:hypothetical protein
LYTWNKGGEGDDSELWGSETGIDIFDTFANVLQYMLSVTDPH